MNNNITLKSYCLVENASHKDPAIPGLMKLRLTTAVKPDCINLEKKNYPVRLALYRGHDNTQENRQGCVCVCDKSCIVNVTVAERCTRM